MARGNVCIEAIAHHYALLPSDPHVCDGCLQQVRLRFADHDRMTTGRRDQRGNERSAAGHQAIFGWQRHVAIGGDELGAVSNTAVRLAQLVVGDIAIESDYDGIGGHGIGVDDFEITICQQLVSQGRHAEDVQPG